MPPLRPPRPRSSPTSTLPRNIPHRVRSLHHLHHIHLPSPHPTYTPYPLASSLQSSCIAAAHHARKAAPGSVGPPQPAVLSFTPPPTYTLGRRQRSLPPEALGALSAPLRVYPRSPDWALRRPSSSSSFSSSSSSIDVARAERDGGNNTTNGEGGVVVEGGEGGDAAVTFTPQVLHSPRGGQTTYHGPGQLVLWPTVDLRSPLHRHFSVRDYASLLEDTTAAVLSSLFGIATVRDPDNPGLWISDRSEPAAEVAAAAGNGSASAGLRKIAALGIHLRRHVATLGLSLNLDTPTAGPADVNPWARFTPCGITGRGVTSVAAELGPAAWAAATAAAPGRGEPGSVAGAWAREFSRRLERSS